MKMRMLKQCDHCGKLQLMTFHERTQYNPFGQVVGFLYTYKCKKCNHFNMIYKEV